MPYLVLHKSLKQGEPSHGNFWCGREVSCVFFSLKKFRVNSLETLEILPLEPLKLFSRAACTRRREAAVLSMQHSFPEAGGWAGDLLLCTEQAELSPRWGEHGAHRP